MKLKNQFMRLHEVSFFENKKIGNTKIEILGVANFSSNNHRTDATFCLTDRCNDCGCDRDCSCNTECRRDCSCQKTCSCDDHFPCTPLP